MSHPRLMLDVLLYLSLNQGIYAATEECDAGWAMTHASDLAILWHPIPFIKKYSVASVSNRNGCVLFCSFLPSLFPALHCPFLTLWSIHCTNLYYLNRGAAQEDNYNDNNNVMAYAMPKSCRSSSRLSRGKILDLP